MSRKVVHTEDATVRSPSGAPRGRHVAFEITVIAGPDAGLSHVFELDAPAPAHIGKGVTCAVRLTDPMASRRHASVAVRDGRLRLTDCASTNGTTVNGVLVVDAYLAGGEVVQMGDTVLKVTRRLVRGESTPLLRERFGRLLGASEPMCRLYPAAQLLAHAEQPALIEGEAGAGKELMCECLHEEGPRAAGPFIVLDCAAARTIEADLFGSGAECPGAFEETGGTLVLDEVGELGLELQTKILHVLERREVRRTGARGARPLAVRVLATTRRNLDAEVDAGRFREDLLQVIGTARIQLPPLRERGGDIAVLAKHFWSQVVAQQGELTPDWISRLEARPWPGNVRELRSYVLCAATLGERAAAPGDPESDAWAAARGTHDDLDTLLALDLPFSQARRHVLSTFEQRYVEHVLERHGGNVTRAAAASGIARRYLQRVRRRALPR